MVPELFLTINVKKKTTTLADKHLQKLLLHKVLQLGVAAVPHITSLSFYQVTANLGQIAGQPRFWMS